MSGIPINEKILWSISEASQYSGICEVTLRKYAKEADCTWSIKVGRVYRVKRKEFEEYLSTAKEL